LGNPIKLPPSSSYLSHSHGSFFDTRGESATRKIDIEQRASTQEGLRVDNVPKGRLRLSISFSFHRRCVCAPLHWHAPPGRLRPPAPATTHKQGLRTAVTHNGRQGKGGEGGEDEYDVCVYDSCQGSSSWGGLPSSLYPFRCNPYHPWIGAWVVVSMMLLLQGGTTIVEDVIVVLWWSGVGRLRL